MHRRRPVSRHARRINSVPMASSASSVTASEANADDMASFQNDDRFADIETALGDFESRFSAIEQNIGNLSASVTSLHQLMTQSSGVQPLNSDLKADLDILKTRLDTMDASTVSTITPDISASIAKQVEAIVTRVSSLSSSHDQMMAEMRSVRQVSASAEEPTMSKHDGDIVTKDIATLKKAIGQLHTNCEKRADIADVDALKRQMSKLASSMSELSASQKSSEADKIRDARVIELETKMADIIQSIETQSEEQQKYAAGMTSDIKTGLNALHEKLATSLLDDLKEIIAKMQLDKLKEDISTMKEDLDKMKDEAQTSTTKRKSTRKKTSVIEVEKS